MVSKKELQKNNDKLLDERQEARRMLLGAEGKIVELEKENSELNEMLMKPSKYVEFGVMLVDVPVGLSKERTDELLKPVQDRMNEQMKSIGIDLSILVMPSNVKSFETHMVDAKKEE